MSLYFVLYETINAHCHLTTCFMFYSLRGLADRAYPYINEDERHYLDMKNRKMRHRAPADFRTCFRGRNIVFLGDSTTNFLSMVAYLSNSR